MNVDRYLLHYRRLGGLFFHFRSDTARSVSRLSHITHPSRGFSSEGTAHVDLSPEYILWLLSFIPECTPMSLLWYDT